MQYSRHSIDSPDAKRLTQAPTCPKCQSPDTSSASKRPNASSYWRCLRCGDVWNPALLYGAPERLSHR
jgi:ribosomal protein L37AE/L43A